jgi:hypothetical protein
VRFWEALPKNKNLHYILKMTRSESYLEKYRKYKRKYQRAGSPGDSDLGLYGESYALKNITQLDPLSLNDLSIALSGKVSHPPLPLLVIVGAPYYHLQDLADLGVGVVPNGAPLTRRSIKPLIELKQQLALGVSDLEVNHQVTRLLLAIPNVPFVSFREVLNLKGETVKPGWVSGVPDPVKYVVDCGSGKLSLHYKSNGNEIKAKRVDDVDQATSTRQLLEKLHQMRNNLGDTVTDSVFYFSGKWRSDPTWKKAYQQFQAPGIRTRIISQQQERDFALQQVTNILHACGIHNKYVVMLDSGGGSTQIATGLI